MLEKTRGYVDNARKGVAHISTGTAIEGRERFNEFVQEGRRKRRTRKDARGAMAHSCATAAWSGRLPNRPETTGQIVSYKNRTESLARDTR